MERCFRFNVGVERAQESAGAVELVTSAVKAAETHPASGAFHLPGGASPVDVFLRWQREACRPRVRLLSWLLGGELPEANAAALATASPDGHPSVRMVLVKSASDEGFVFYTSYASRKGSELEAMPRAALVFYWSWPPRQVRVEGQVERLSAEQSDVYWRSRPRGSRLSAAASRQSSAMTDRSVLVARVQELRRLYEGRDVPRPADWGGYRVIPEAIELWEGRANRLHERACYRRTGGGQASIAELLQP